MPTARPPPLKVHVIRRNAIAMHSLSMAQKRSREGGHESDGTSDEDSRALAKPHFLDDLLALHVFLWSFKTNRWVGIPALSLSALLSTECATSCWKSCGVTSETLLDSRKPIMFSSGPKITEIQRKVRGEASAETCDKHSLASSFF